MKLFSKALVRFRAMRVFRSVWFTQVGACALDNGSFAQYGIFYFNDSLRFFVLFYGNGSLRLHAVIRLIDSLMGDVVIDHHGSFGILAIICSKDSFVHRCYIVEVWFIWISCHVLEVWFTQGFWYDCSSRFVYKGHAVFELSDSFKLVAVFTWNDSFGWLAVFT